MDVRGHLHSYKKKDHATELFKNNPQSTRPQPVLHLCEPVRHCIHFIDCAGPVGFSRPSHCAALSGYKPGALPLRGQDRLLEPGGAVAPHGPAEFSFSENLRPAAAGAVHTLVPGAPVGAGDGVLFAGFEPEADIAEDPLRAVSFGDAFQFNPHRRCCR